MSPAITAPDDARRLDPRTRSYLQVAGLCAGAAIGAKAIKMMAAFRPAHSPIADAPAEWIQSFLQLAGHSSLVRLFALGLVWATVLLLVRGRRRLIIACTPPLLFVAWRVSAMVRDGRSWSDSVLMRYLGNDGPTIASLYVPDFRFIALACVASALALFLVPERHLRKTRVVLFALAGLCVTVIGIELAQFQVTGMPGDAHFLAFAFENAKGIFPIVRSQLNVVSASMLLVPAVVGVAASALLVFGAGRVNTDRRVTPIGVAVASLFVPVVVLGWNPRLTDGRMLRVAHNPIIELGGLRSGDGPRQIAAVQSAARLPLLFDTKKLSFQSNGGVARRNVVLVMLESTRATATSLYAPFLPTTPNLAWLAQRGATIDDLYVVAPRTTAAWMAIMYGVWPSTDDVNEAWSRSATGQITSASLPRMLRQVGYATGFFTPTYLTFIGDNIMLERIGFDALVGAEQLAAERPKLTYMGVEDEQIVKPALAWADSSVARGQPFFLSVMTAAAHHDYRQPASWNKRQFVKGAASYNDYLNSVAYSDASVVEGLLRGLRERQLLDSTIVIILGDHGQAFGEHQEMVHGRSVYEETVRVPGVIYAPGRVVAGSRIVGTRQEIDLLPTIADLLDFRLEGGHVPGMSLLSDAAHDREIWLSSAFFQSSLGLRQGNRKVHFFFDRAPTQVFDLDADPSEQQDIARSVSAQELRGYEERLLLWRARVRRSLFSN